MARAPVIKTQGFVTHAESYVERRPSAADEYVVSIRIQPSVPKCCIDIERMSVRCEAHAPAHAQ